MTAHRHRAQATHTPISREQRLEEELQRLRKDFTSVKHLFTQAQQELETAQIIAAQLHHLTISNQMKTVADLQNAIQHKRMRRVNGYQAKINRYQSFPYKLLVFASAFLGTNTGPALLSSEVRDLQRRRDWPDEEERYLVNAWQRALGTLNALHARRNLPPETPELRQAREKVRSIQSYLTALFRQIRTKEIEFESEKALKAQQAAAAHP